MAFWKKGKSGQPELDRSIAAWRRIGAPDLRLSGASRARIVREARKTSDSDAAHEPLRSLFLPTSRLALGATVPIGALSALFVAVMTFQGGVVPVQPEARTRIEAAKVGDEVVFVIRNGDRVHTISKSSDPGRFSAEPQLRTETGRFQDRLDEDSNIVFYRID